MARPHLAGIGEVPAGVIETNFEEVCITDLFGEQVVLCGGTTALVKAGFDMQAALRPSFLLTEILGM